MKTELLNTYIPLEEIEVGMEAKYSQTITDADIKAFAGISGDRNPVHLDEKYAENSQFNARIAHGMMTASYFSALFGTKIPGEGCVYTHQSLAFKKPVYIGDTVLATVKVSEIDLDKRRVKFKTVCTVDEKTVTTGEAELYVPPMFQKVIVNNKTELIKYKENILELFKRCFNSEMDEILWQWAYIDNPNGEPIVSLYFEKDVLIGHYAVIPVSLTHQQRTIKAVLSMTTMVDAKYRKYGVFVDQANIVYKKAASLGYKLVYGFPNKNSSPGFKKRLGWTLEEDLYVANLNYGELQELTIKTCPDDISFNTQDRENMDWRLSKPGVNYSKALNNVLKQYEDDFDILFNGADFYPLQRDKNYNILINEERQKYQDKKVFDYIFGYKIFDPLLEGVNFKKDLIMSDVF
jgi:acyl dehydratase